MLHEDNCFGFGEILFDAFGEVRIAEFGDYIGVIFGGEDVMDIEDAGDVPEFFQDIDLGIEESSIDLVFEHFEVDDLNGHWLI